LSNFINLAVGSGEGETFPLDLKKFISNFNLDLMETYQSLKILEMNGDILFNESVFNPTKIKFAVGNTMLYSFQIKYDSVSNLITLISRSYPGVFDQFQEISEKEFCKRLKITPDVLKKQLQFLEQNGILDIAWRTDLPLVTFLHERLPDTYMRLKEEIYEKRKTLALMRWERMKQFLTTPVCRAQFLIQYFGQESEPCGKCDFCRSQKQANYTTEEIAKIVLKQLQSPKTLDELKTENEIIPETDLLRTLHWLQLEDHIVYSAGFYSTN
jgi:ATP-dependent DNA helicase RecQ